MATITLGDTSVTVTDIANGIRSVPSTHGGKLSNCKKNNAYRLKGCDKLLLTDARVSFNLSWKQSYSQLANEAARLMSVNDYSEIVTGMTAYMVVLNDLRSAIKYHLEYLKTFDTGTNNKKRCCQKKSSLEGYKNIDRAFFSEVSDIMVETKNIIDSVEVAEAAYNDLESSDRDRDEADANANTVIALSNTRIAGASLTVGEMKKEELIRKILTGVLIGGAVFVGYKLFKAFKK